MQQIASILRSLNIIQRRIQQHPIPITQEVSNTYQDMTVVQVQVLLSVMTHQPVGVKRLAELRNISSSAATQAIDLLEKKGLVARERDEQDRRCTLVSLSPDYQQRVSEFKQNLSDHYGSLFETLDAEEMTEFARLSEKIVGCSNA